ncbi:hydantoinase B/oxoprolinase family protein [Capillimicrobium parvum]|uniref:Acetophenone carboxylase delta subunit n=1 Tax=Capillimicrobium parvum TaxID=2884022 RepID=A0A9E7BZJ4_9ACTN|nr:hydantoinase B/oxoprolinase family protein [Capillimicrobium parvum]UGS34527.1 Acetophenone carboxylase delta subunit [Capillimicrobium parvum]
MATTTRVDPVTAAVIAGALESIATEMGHKLARMSYSSIIRESEDFGCVICDADGQQLCESPQSTPLQSGPIPGYVRGINRRFAELGDAWGPGDVVMHNHSYYGASHQPDVAFVIPVFHGDQLVGFSATAAHHLDLGALTPGTVGIVDAIDSYAEGLQFNAVKVEEDGRRNEQVWRMVADNVRIPALVLPDMEAQIAGARLGAERYLQLIERYGLDTVRAASADLLDQSEAALRRAIERIPDGRYEAEGMLDGFPELADPQYRDWVVRVAITVEGSSMHVDLTGTSEQTDKPYNMPFVGTVDIAVLLTVRSILLDSAVHDAVPANSGLFRPITIEAPLGSMANPVFPAPTTGRAMGGNIVADTVMRALAPVVPDRVSAGIGNLKATALSGVTDGEPWVHMEIIEGSYGGRLGKDGLDAVDTLYANTRNNPIEDVESHHPLRIERYELWEGHVGDGRWRGGLGCVRDIGFTAPGGYTIDGDGTRHAPPGLFGGEPGSPGSVILNPGTDRETVLPPKVAHRRAEAGDVLRFIGPAGGGYGPPSERDPEARRADAMNGLTSEA